MMEAANRHLRLQSGVRAVLIAVAVACGVLWLPSPVAAQGAGGARAQAAVAQTDGSSAASPAGRAGLRAGGDPTGAVAPLAPEAAGALREALSTSSEGLREVPIPTGAGGVMVNLEGRFHSIMKIETGADGGLSSRCLPASAAANAETSATPKTPK